MRRCYDVSCPAFPDYGGRGVTVQDDWHDFRRFFADVPPRPTAGHTFGRVDNSGGYSRRNTRWETRTQNNNNRRNNVLITAQNKTMTAAEWGRNTGLSRGLVLERVKIGWSPEKAATTPAGRPGQKPRTKYRRNGELLSLWDWSKKLNVKYGTMKWRAKHGKLAGFTPVTVN